MDVKEAVTKARTYIADLFQDEGIENVGLEEVVFEDGEDVWKITIGFNRPWDHMRVFPGAFEVLSRKPEWEKRRAFKVVRIEDGSGKVLSLTHRAPPA